MKKIEVVKKIIKNNKNILIIILVIGFSFYLMMLLKSNNRQEGNSENEIEAFLLETEEAEKTELDQSNHTPEEEEVVSKEIVIDIKGAIKNPGVYTMDEGMRVNDAIEKAGGVLTDAETTTVNFAEILTDQMVIYVPEVGEELPQLDMVPQESTQENEENLGIIDINTANKSELMSLNGIGEVKAESIIAYREENGEFLSTEDLKNVSGIGEKTFENLKDFIAITP